MLSDRIGKALNIKEKIRHLPEDAGVYLMQDKLKKVIYVGKAKNLKKRVLSYFQDSNRPSHRLHLLRTEIVEFSIMVVNNEVEALLLERSLIKHHKPKFNVLLRDDKEYPILRIDLQEDWPRIEKVRRRQNDGATYIGPFVHVGQLNRVLQTVQNCFPLVRCSRYEFKNSKRPCNYYHMQQCLGPCVLPCDAKTYRKMVKSAIKVLQGDHKRAISILERRMTQAASDLKFEIAAQLRDQIKALQSFESQQHVIFSDIKNIDIVGFAEKPNFIAFHLLLVRDYRLLGFTHFNFDSPVESIGESMNSFLLQYYENNLIHENVLVPFVNDGIKELGLALSVKENTLREATTESELKLMKMACKNARVSLSEYIRERQISPHLMSEVKKLFQFPYLPKTIECIDISHIQGTATVGSLVHFRDGKPDKGNYRIYNLDDEAVAPDDYLAIETIVERRLKRGLAEESLPDLLLIDGGKGQLNAALKAQEKFNNIKNMKIASIAKSRRVKEVDHFDNRINYSSERIFLPDQDEAVELEIGSPIYRLLTHLRDEAHRFAIKQHRKRRKTIRHRSRLEEVSGIGPKLRTHLYEIFTDLETMKKASLSDLEKVKGLRSEVAKNLLEFLKTL